MPATKPKPAIHPFDVAHGTDTSGIVPGRILIRGTEAEIDDVTAYYGIAPSILEGLLDIWLQRCHPQASIENTVLVDVGAGKGRAALLASEYPCKAVFDLCFEQIENRLAGLQAISHTEVELVAPLFAIL